MESLGRFWYYLKATQGPHCCVSNFRTAENFSRGRDIWREVQGGTRRQTGSFCKSAQNCRWDHPMSWALIIKEWFCRSWFNIKVWFVQEHCEDMGTLKRLSVWNKVSSLFYNLIIELQLAQANQICCQWRHERLKSGVAAINWLCHQLTGQ